MSHFLSPALTAAAEAAATPPASSLSAMPPSSFPFMALEGATETPSTEENSVLQVASLLLAQSLGSRSVRIRSGKVRIDLDIHYTSVIYLYYR